MDIEGTQEQPFEILLTEKLSFLQFMSLMSLLTHGLLDVFNKTFDDFP